jgi:hypothetical protein
LKTYDENKSFMFQRCANDASTLKVLPATTFILLKEVMGITATSDS